MTSLPFVRRTFATLRMAEFGFLGVRVITCTHTPRRKGLPSKAGDFDLAVTLRRPLRTSWLIVGIREKGNLRMKSDEKGTTLLCVESSARTFWLKVRRLAKA